MTSAAAPFTIAVSEQVLSDLRRRLSETAWPGETIGTGWERGANLAYMHELARHWAERYDWRRHEDALNRFHHYRATVDGAAIHFVHERGRGPHPRR